MLQKYLDVGTLLRAVNMSNLLMSAILSKEQRLLLMFQRRQIVEEAPSDQLNDEESSEQEDFATTFQAQLNSKKPFDRIFALGKVTYILKAYEDNDLNQLDKKLIKGFYSNRLESYKYLARSKPLKDDEAVQESDQNEDSANQLDATNNLPQNDSAEEIGQNENQPSDGRISAKTRKKKNKKSKGLDLGFFSGKDSADKAKKKAQKNNKKDKFSFAKLKGGKDARDAAAPNRNLSLA